MATSVLSASFAVFLVRERECRSKGVQVVAGASPSAFWSAAYAWDLLNFSLPTLGTASQPPSLASLPAVSTIGLPDACEWAQMASHLEQSWITYVGPCCMSARWCRHHRLLLLL